MNFCLKGKQLPIIDLSPPAPLFSRPGSVRFFPTSEIEINAEKDAVLTPFMTTKQICQMHCRTFQKKKTPRLLSEVEIRLEEMFQ